ncbi:MAG: hypothetical protein AAF772_20670, partial [Acidobacteriota bacterium]
AALLGLALLLTAPLADADDAPHTPETQRLPGVGFGESFDQPGSDPTASMLMDLFVTGDASWQRLPLGADDGVPASVPSLPVAQDGDAELVLMENVGGIAGGSFALTANTVDETYGDVWVSAVVGMGFQTAFGSRAAGLMVRAETATVQLSDLTAYGAQLNHNNVNTATVSLLRFQNGIGTAVRVSALFDFDPPTENVRLRLSAVGDQLTVQASRLTVEDGVVVERPIDLDDAPGLQDGMAVRDSSFAVGRVGVRGFTRADNRVAFDNFVAAPTLFADGFESGDVEIWSAAIAGADGLRAARPAPR